MSCRTTTPLLEWWRRRVTTGTALHASYVMISSKIARGWSARIANTSVTRNASSSSTPRATSAPHAAAPTGGDHRLLEKTNKFPTKQHQVKNYLQMQRGAVVLAGLVVLAVGAVVLTGV